MHHKGLTSPNSRYIAFVITLLFFTVGVFSVFIEAILPVLKSHYAIDYTVFSLFDTSFFICYALFSYIIAYIIRKIGINRGLLTGLLVVAAGCLLWFIFLRFLDSNIIQYLVATFIIATGVVILLIVAELAGLYFTGSAKQNHLSLFQSSDAIGAFLAPLILTQLLYKTSFIDGRHLEMIASIFFIASLLLIALCVIIKSIQQPIVEDHAPPLTANIMPQCMNAARFRWVWLAVFIYVGVEVTIGTFIINEGIYHYHLAANHASWSLSLYWMLFIFGRLVGGFYLGKIPDYLVVLYCCLIAIALLLVSMHTTTVYGLYALVLVGLSNAVIFPLLYSMGLMCTDQPSILLSGKLASAISGGAFIPLISGWVADHVSLGSSLNVCLASYIILSIIAITAFRRPNLSSPN